MLKCRNQSTEGKYESEKKANLRVWFGSEVFTKWLEVLLVEAFCANC